MWTPELHSRFVNAINHLGLSNAVPKTILQLMNVEGMTRENVASHLQKYRLYIRRIVGLPPNAKLPAEFAAFARPYPMPNQAVMQVRQSFIRAFSVTTHDFGKETEKYVFSFSFGRGL